MQNIGRLYGALFSAIFAVSWAAPLIKLIDAPGPTIAFYRLFFAFCLLSPLSFWRTKKAFQSFSIAEWVHIVAAGMFLALHFGLWITALSHTSITSAVLIIATQPLFCAVFSYLIFSERPTPPLICGILVALLGTVLVGYADLTQSLGSLFGDLLALFGSLAGVAYFIIGRRVRARLELFSYVFPVFAVAAILLGSFCAWQGLLAIPSRGQDLQLLVLLAAGPTVLGHGLLNWSLRYLSATSVNLTLLGEPIIASLLAFLLFSERHPLLLYFGGGLILAGIVLGILEKPSGSSSTRMLPVCQKDARSL